MRQDGFNTVILVVPWAGFATSMTDGSLIPERARRLGEIISLAADSGLNVVLRVGYAWDASVAGSGGWLLNLWLREDAYQGWLDYIEGLHNIASAHENVQFAFLSWEDLWAVEGLGKAPLERRLQLAQQTGFQDWLERYSTLDAVSARFGQTFTRFEQIPVPERMTPAFGLFFDFIDHAWIARFFGPAQERFPSMSMEIRIDSDPVWNGAGELAYWHSHELAWDLPGADWTTIYWAPAMGGLNQGETLSPETAANRLEAMLERIRAVTGNRPIFIDQFLVEDFTPGFESNGRIDRDQVGNFLQRAQPVLEQLAHGYALWTWRDYQHNAVPSPDFSDGGSSWGYQATGENAPLQLKSGESLRRDFSIHEFHSPGGPQSAELCVQTVGDGNSEPDLLIHTQYRPEPLLVDASGAGGSCIGLLISDTTSVTLKTLAPLSLKTIGFSGFTQPTGMRFLNGSKKPVATAWQTLNQSLQRPNPAPFVRYGDGWMGKTFNQQFSASGAAPQILSFTTRLPETWPFTPQITVDVDQLTLTRVACSNNQEHTLPLPKTVSQKSGFELAMTVDRTYQVGNDERRLGCLIDDITVQAVSDNP